MRAPSHGGRVMAETESPWLVCRTSHGDHATTLGRLLDAVGVHGLTLFAHLDHAAAAKAAGRKMPPSDVLIVGSAAVGTPLMTAHPHVAIDLPLRILVRELSPGGAAEVCFDDPTQLASRHHLSSDAATVLTRMRAALDAIAALAAGSP